MLFEYEGVGKVKMKAGSCFYQPPNIRHRELGHSRDLEMIEVVSPARFKTYCFGETCSQKVTGPSFTRLTCMWAPKRPVATRGSHSSAFSTKRWNSRSAARGRRGAREARPRAAVGIRGERELRHREQLPAHVLQRQVHLAPGVGKDAIAQHALGEQQRLDFGVAALDADQREHAGADHAHGLAGDLRRSRPATR